jgi:uncharacterized protein (AIM24 family)
MADARAAASAPAITSPSILKLAAPLAPPAPAAPRPFTRPTAAASVSRDEIAAATPQVPAPVTPSGPREPVALPPPIPAPIAPFVPPGDLDETQRVRMPSIGRPVAAPVTDRVRMAPPDDSAPGSDSAIPFPEAELPADLEVGDVELEPSVTPSDEPAVSPLAVAPGPTPPASAVAMATESRPLFHVRPDGGLEIASRGVVFVRKGSVVWYSGKMRFAAEASFRGTRLEKILRADGRGYLYVHDPGRQAYRRELTGESLFLEGSRILALDNGLSFRLEPIHDFRMNRRVDILKIFGRGSVILSVGGPLLAHEVSPEFPLNVSSRDLVAWTGELVPSVLEDRFLEEVMMPDVGSAPKIRFEGEGTVLTEPPRPRRRASDVSRTTEADRRV